jgi:hypothetical protein
VFVVPTGTFKHAVLPHPWRSIEPQKNVREKTPPKSITSDAKKELDASLGLPETGVGAALRLCTEFPLPSGQTRTGSAGGLRRVRSAGFTGSFCIVKSRSCPGRLYS